MEVNAEKRVNVGKGCIRKQNSLPLEQKENTILFGVRNSVKLFVGRDKQLDNLHKILQNETIVVISGIDGIGKSELAKKYISEYRGNYDNRIVWINAESRQAIVQSFRTLAADELQISTKNVDDNEKDIICVVKDVYKYFSDKKSLFIFDNVKKYQSSNEFDDGINEYIPVVVPDLHKPHIIIISHNQQWPKNIQVLHLNEFTMEESMEFIKESLGTENNLQETDVKLLAIKLQCIPLALQQAVVCISIQTKQLKHTALKFDINDYIEMYEKNIAIIDYDSLDYSDRNYYKIIFTAWNITWQTIKQNKYGNAALEILNIISYLASDNIPIELFFYLKKNKKKFTSVFELLKQYSLINIEQDMINIHQFIQQAVRLKLREQEKDSKYIMKAVELFNGNNLQKYNVNHAIQIWNYSSKHTELMKKNLPLAHLITCTVIKNGMLEDGYSFGSKVVKVLEPLSSNNIDIMSGFLTAKHNVAMALMKMDKLDESLELLKEILSIEESISPISEANLNTRRNIASVLYRQCKFADALKLNTSTLYLCRNKLGKNHRSTLIVGHDIATILLHQKKYDEAKEILQQVYKSQKDNLGENDSDTLDTLDTIAEAARISNDKYEGSQQDKANVDARASTTRIKKATELLVVQGKLSEALKMLKETYIIQIQWLDENHSDILLTKYHMAEVLRHLGRYNEALTICQSVLDLQTKRLGSNHPDVLNTLQGHADIYSDIGKYQGALEEYQVVLKKRKTREGENHPNTLKVMTSIATVHSKLLRVDIAYKMFEKILHIQKDILPDDHFDVVTANVGMAIVLYHVKQYDRALKILDKALDIMQFHPNHPDIFVIKNYKGLIFRGQEKYTEALKIFDEVINAQIPILGHSHPSVKMTQEYVKSVISAQKKPIFEWKLNRNEEPVDNNTNDPNKNLIATVTNGVQSIKIYENAL